MKWLFAVLVALNIIVFSGMVAYRMADKRATAEALVEGGRYELAQPESLNSKPPEPEAQPEWVAAPENQADMPEPESEEAAAERLKKEREAKIAKEKKERAEKERREKEAKANLAANTQSESGDSTSAAAAIASRQCTPVASVSMDEDDYHRIKGLLNKWPHAASRSVEKRAAKKGENAVSKTFRVLIPTEGDALEKLGELSSKGFTGVIYNGEISLGVTRSRSSAQILISRLSGAGFGGARILEQEEKGSSDGALSVARMNVTFMAVNEQDAQDIRNVVGRYGQLNVRACK